jgi:hypothetical protein
VSGPEARHLCLPCKSGSPANGRATRGRSSEPVEAISACRVIRERLVPMGHRRGRHHHLSHLHLHLVREKPPSLPCRACVTRRCKNSCLGIGARPCVRALCTAGLGTLAGVDSVAPPARKGWPTAGPAPARHKTIKTICSSFSHAAAAAAAAARGPPCGFMSWAGWLGGQRRWACLSGG